MDKEHRWHVLMDKPEVLPTVDIEVTPEIGALFQDSAGDFFGDVFIDFMDSQIRTILQFLGLDADTLPIFVTDDVTAEALGYHTAFALDDNGNQLQTFIFTSWLDPAASTIICSSWCCGSGSPTRFPPRPLVGGTPSPIPLP
jgi:hypothetical protein